MTGCPHCHTQTPHPDAYLAARCALRAASTDGIRDYAATLGANPVAAVDLLAHLRGALDEGEAHRVVRYVLDLGWRPVVDA